MTSTWASATEDASAEYGSEGGKPGPGDRIDVDAGASGGDDSSFHLSTGGMVAIIVVVAAVVLFGGE